MIIILVKVYNFKMNNSIVVLNYLQILYALNVFEKKENKNQRYISYNKAKKNYLNKKKESKYRFKRSF